MVGSLFVLLEGDLRGFLEAVAVARDQAQPMMPMKVAKDATVAISRRMLMSMAGPSLT
jgi:hypothetical protein